MIERTWETEEAQLRNRLAKNTISFRDCRKLTQKTAAKLARISERHWQRIEAADAHSPTLETIVRIAIVLNVQPLTLLR